MINPAVTLAVFRRDVRGYFTTPTGYVFISLFIVASACLLFVWDGRFFSENLANLNVLNEFMPYLLLLFVPAVTMNIWADERRQGTDALLLTLPATDADIVLGKYLAVVSIFTISLLFSLSNLWFLARLGSPDMGLMFGTYLGYWLMGITMLAAGMVASLLSRNATFGFVLGVGLCGLTIAPQMLGWLSETAKTAFYNRPIEADGGVERTLSVAPILLLLAFVTIMLAMRSVMRSWLLPGLGVLIALLVASLVWIPQGIWDGARQFGVVQRFARIGAGEAVLGDLLYFFALAGAFLYVNILLLGRRFWAGTRETRFLWVHAMLKGASTTVGAVAVVVLLGYTEVRADLTAESLHSLSPVTQSLLKEVAAKDNTTVLIQAYVSPEMPQEYVRPRLDLLAMLRRFEDLGRGRIRVNVHDTMPYTARAREAKDSFGIEPVQVLDTASGRQSVESVFMGIAVTCGLEREVIPFLYSGLSAEYELTRSIRVVAGSDRRRVGVLDTGLKLFGEYDAETRRETKDFPLIEELKKQYEVISIDPTKDYPGTAVAEAGGDGEGQDASPGEPKLHALIVIQPCLLEQPQMDRLKAYIHDGNAVLLLQDPWPEVNPRLSPAIIQQEEAQARPQPGQDRPTRKGNIDGLMDSIGIKIPIMDIVWARHNPHPKLADLSRDPERVIFVHGGGGQWKVFDQESPVTQGLQEIVMLYVGNVLPSGTSTTGLSVKPLLWSPGNNGMTTLQLISQKAQNQIFGIVPQGMYAKTSEEQSVIAGRVNGAFETGKKARVTVVADIDFILSSFVWSLRTRGVPEFNFDNVTFVLNAIDELAGDVGLLELRKRRPLHRTLSVIETERNSFQWKLDAFTKTAEEDAEAEIARLRAENQKRIADIDKQEGLDAKSKEQIRRATEKSLQEQLDRRIKEINENKELQVSVEREKVEELVSGIEDDYKVFAVIIPPIPALLLGIVVFVIRRRREYASISSSRTLKS